MRPLILLVLLVAACASAPATTVAPTVLAPATPTSAPLATPSPRPPTTPPSTPTVTPSAQTSASPSSGLDLCDNTDRATCELAAGTYSPSLTTPTMTFALQEGWTGVRHYADGFSLVHEDAILSFARDVTFGGAEPEPGLGGFEALLRSVSALQVADAELTTLGGLPAVQLDVVAVDDAVAFFALDEDVYNLSQGQKARVVVVDVAGVVGVFIVESSTEDTFDAAIAAAQPVLDSLVFE